MRVLTRCAHSFRKPKRQVFLSPSIKCFKDVFGRWTDLKIAMRQERHFLWLYRRYGFEPNSWCFVCHHSWGLYFTRRELHTTISECFKDFFSGRALQGARDITAMIYPTNIPGFSDENNRKIVTTFSSVLFNTQVMAIKNDGHLFTLINVMLDFLLKCNKYLKGIPG